MQIWSREINSLGLKVTFSVIEDVRTRAVGGLRTDLIQTAVTSIEGINFK